MKIHNFDIARKTRENFTLYTQYWRGDQIVWLHDSAANDYGMAFLYIGCRPSVNVCTGALLNWEVTF